MAATCTIDTAGNWSTPGNWNCGHFPTTADTAVLDGSYNVTINQSMATTTFTIASTYTGTITGSTSYSITTTGNFIVHARTMPIVGGIYVGGNFTQDGGTVNAANAFLVAGTFSLSAGTFNVGAAYVALMGAASVTGTGIFNNNTGKVAFGSSVASGGTFNGNTGTALLHGSATTVAMNSFSALHVEDTLDTDLIAYFKFDEADGDSFMDWSGSGRHGTINGTSWATSTLKTFVFPNSAAMVFPTDTNVSFPFNIQPDAITVSAWVKITGNSTGFPRIVHLSHFRLYIGSGATHLVGALSDRGTDGNWQTTSTLATHATNWNHLLVTYNGANPANQPIIYVNGSSWAFTQLGGPATAGYAAATASGYIGNDSGLTGDFIGEIDDVRIYDAVLTPTQVAALYAAGHANSSSRAVTIAGSANTTVSGNLVVERGNLTTSTFTTGVNGTTTIDDGASMTTGAGTVTLGDATADTVTVDGTLTIGGGRTTALGNVTVNNGASLVMNNDAGSLRMTDPGTDNVLTINGTLQTTTGTSTASTRPTIDTASGTYTFSVSTAAANVAVLDINGLTVKNTGTLGMNINTHSSATTTFTNFKGIDFLTGTAATQLLKISASTLNATFTDIKFDTTNSTYNVYLYDRDLMNQTDVRAIFTGGCTATNETDCESFDLDGDTDLTLPPAPAANDNLADSGSNGGNGAIVSFGHGVHTDTAGTISGHAVSAFNWSNFSHYSTYVLFNGTSGNDDTLYARDSNGVVKYLWTNTTAGESFIGSPRWTEEGGVHYVYVLTNKARIYKWKDMGTSGAGGFDPAPAPWDTVYWSTDADSSATSPMVISGGYIYWAGNNTSAAPRLFRLAIAGKNMLGEYALAAGTVINAAPSLATVKISGVTAPHLFAVSNKNPASGTVYRVLASDFSGPDTFTTSADTSGRISVVYGRAYLVDKSGKVWASTIAGASSGWVYHDATASHAPTCVAGNANCVVENFYLDVQNERVMFGDYDGHVYCVEAGAVCSGGTWPFQPGTSSDRFTTAPLFNAGLIIIGSENGNVFFIDRSAATLVRKVELGTGVKISTVSYDRNTTNTGEYVVGTATAPGKLYYIDAANISDPTSGTP